MYLLLITFNYRNVCYLCFLRCVDAEQNEWHPYLDSSISHKKGRYVNENDSQIPFRYLSTMDWPSSYDQSTLREEHSEFHRSLLGTQSNLFDRPISVTSSLGCMKTVAFLQWMNCRLEADTNHSSLWVWLWMVIVTPRNSTISLRFNSNAPLDCAWDRKKMPWLTLETMYMWQVTEALTSDTLLTEKPVCPVSFCFLIDMQLLLISQCPLFWTKRVH